MRAADGRRQRLLGLSLVIGPAIGLGYGREISDSGDGGFFDGQTRANAGFGEVNCSVFRPPLGMKRFTKSAARKPSHSKIFEIPNRANRRPILRGGDPRAVRYRAEQRPIRRTPLENERDHPKDANRGNFHVGGGHYRAAPLWLKPCIAKLLVCLFLPRSGLLRSVWVLPRRLQWSW